MGLPCKYKFHPGLGGGKTPALLGGGSRGILLFLAQFALWGIAYGFFQFPRILVDFRGYYPEWHGTTVVPTTSAPDHLCSRPPEALPHDGTLGGEQYSQHCSKRHGLSPPRFAVRFIVFSDFTDFIFTDYIRA